MAQKLKKMINSKLDLPSEIVLNTPKITLDSNEKMLVENFKGLIELSDTFVRINAIDYTIAIEGTSLCVGYMTKEEICILGSIKNVIYD